MSGTVLGAEENMITCDMNSGTHVIKIGLNVGLRVKLKLWEDTPGCTHHFCVSCARSYTSPGDIWTPISRTLE